MLNFSVVFPGQGSQAVGMLKGLTSSNPVIEQTFKEASKIVGFDCWELAEKGPESLLNQTAYTQPVLLAANIAVWRAYKLACPDNQPQLLAGHSLGEYAALVAAGAISFEDALKIVAKRGQFMQSAAPFEQQSGSMAAILGLDDETIEQVCKEVTDSKSDAHYLVAPANYNTIGQTVIAGHPEAVAEAIELMKTKGAKRALVLPVSVPSHCALMQPAAENLAKELESIIIQTPKIPVLHNRDVNIHSDPNAIKQILCEQLVHPVRWVETIQKLAQNKVQNIIECGPGKVLSGLIKRIDSQLCVYNTDTLENFSETICLK